MKDLESTDEDREIAALFEEATATQSCKTAIPHINKYLININTSMCMNSFITDRTELMFGYLTSLSPVLLSTESYCLDSHYHLKVQKFPDLFFFCSLAFNSVHCKRQGFFLGGNFHHRISYMPLRSWDLNPVKVNQNEISKQFGQISWSNRHLYLFVN